MYGARPMPSVLSATFLFLLASSLIVSASSRRNSFSDHFYEYRLAYSVGLNGAERFSVSEAVVCTIDRTEV